MNFGIFLAPVYKIIRKNIALWPLGYYNYVPLGGQETGLAEKFINKENSSSITTMKKESKK